MKNFNIYSSLLLLGVLFLIILYKVLEVPVTHDEVPAAMFYSNFSFWEIMMFPDNIPNNHILNTLSTKICIILFGKEQWAIRLPNLLSFILFSVGVWRIVTNLFNKDSWFVLPAILLFINPYLLDFFGLCRGYGMSDALLTLGASYLVTGFMYSRDKHIWISFLLSILASYANFTLLVFFASSGLMTLFYFIRKTSRNGKLLKQVGLLALIGILYLALIAIPIYKMHQTNEFQYWTSKGFYQETISSLIHNWKYDSTILSHLRTHVIVFFIFLVLALNLFLIIRKLIKSGVKVSILNNPVFVTTTLLLLTTAINILQTKLLNTPNLNGRTALLFYPLFSAVLVSSLALIKSQRTILNKILPILLLITGLLNLAHRTSLKSVKEWSYDQDNLNVTRYLKEQSVGKKVSLKTSWFFNPSLRFYADTGKIPWIELYGYDKNIDINTDANYYYIFAKDYPLLEPRFEVVFKFSEDRWLLQRKN